MKMKNLEEKQRISNFNLGGFNNQSAIYVQNT